MALTPYAWVIQLSKNKQFRRWLITIGPVATKAFAEFLKRLRHREAGIRQAHEIDGEFSIATIDGERHVIVWKDGRPFSAFPPVEGDIEAKLEHYNRSLLKRPDDLARRKAQRLVNRRGGGSASHPPPPNRSPEPSPSELPPADDRA